MTKNAFYFLLNALFVLKIFIFLFCLFGYLEKCFDKKAKVNFKIYDFTDWTTNNCNDILLNVSRRIDNQEMNLVS